MDIYDSSACIGYTFRRLTGRREYTVARLRAIVTNIIHLSQEIQLVERSVYAVCQFLVGQLLYIS